MSIFHRKFTTLGIKSPRIRECGMNVLRAEDPIRTAYIISLGEARNDTAKVSSMLQSSILAHSIMPSATSKTIAKLKAMRNCLERYSKELNKLFEEEIMNGQKETENSINFTKTRIKN